MDKAWKGTTAMRHPRGRGGAICLQISPPVYRRFMLNNRSLGGRTKALPYRYVVDVCKRVVVRLSPTKRVSHGGYSVPLNSRAV